jgi:hypothetical protein
LSIISALKKAVDEGYTIEKCVDDMTLRSWKGFNVEWMANGGKNEKNGRSGGKVGFSDARRPGDTDWLG